MELWVILPQNTSKTAHFWPFSLKSIFNENLKIDFSKFLLVYQQTDMHVFDRKKYGGHHAIFSVTGCHICECQ